LKVNGNIKGAFTNDGGDVGPCTAGDARHDTEDSEYRQGSFLSGKKIFLFVVSQADY
jgi:hypothetical protein